MEKASFIRLMINTIVGFCILIITLVAFFDVLSVWSAVTIIVAVIFMIINTFCVYFKTRNKKESVYRADLIKFVDEVEAPVYIADPVSNEIKYANKPFLSLLELDEFFDINGYDESKILVGDKNSKEKDFVEAILNSDMVFKTKYILITKWSEEINVDVALSGVDFNRKRHIIKIIKKI